MKHWQIAAIMGLLMAGAAAIVICQPGARTVSTTRSVVPAPEVSPLTLLFVGDVMLARSVGDMMAWQHDWRWPFAAIASTTRAADLTFGNLETTISMHGAPTGCGYCFRADPRVMNGLTFAGFDVLSVANNHTHDYGPVAFADTIGYLASQSIAAAGGEKLVLETVRGTRVAYLAYTYPIAEERMRADIALMRTQADIVVVSMHAGTEYEPVHDADQERIAHAAVDAGADLVIGTHPHVVQDVEQYNGKWIVYSLGNFVFDQDWSDATRQGLMVRATVAHGAIVSLDRIPIEISKQYQVLIP